VVAEYVIDRDAVCELGMFPGPKLAHGADGRAPEKTQFVIRNCCDTGFSMSRSCVFPWKMQFVTFIPEPRPYKTPNVAGLLKKLQS
jgi:hypothetical protein